MSFNTPLIVQKMNAQLGYLTERQALLAQNVANIDTPTYRATDLKKRTFDDMISSSAARLPMAGSSAKHMGGTLNTGGKFAFGKDKDTAGKKMLGNNVVLEEQLGKISDVGAKHELTSTLMKKYHQLYLTAVNTRGGA